jgi:hypothetical protein
MYLWHYIRGGRLFCSCAIPGCGCGRHVSWYTAREGEDRPSRRRGPQATRVDVMAMKPPLTSRIGCEASRVFARVGAQNVTSRLQRPSWSVDMGVTCTHENAIPLVKGRDVGAREVTGPII